MIYKKVCQETGEIFYTPYPWQKYKNKKISKRVKERRSYNINKGNIYSRHYSKLLKMVEYNRERRRKFEEQGLCKRCGTRLPEGTTTKLCDKCIKEAGCKN